MAENMMGLRKFFLPVLALIMAMNFSCKREQFDEKKYIEIGDTLSPIDSVDQYQTWTLINSISAFVKIDTSLHAQWIKILTADPLVSADAEVAVQVPVEGADRVSLEVSYPKRLATLYAALVDAEGRYTVTAFTPEVQTSVDFSSPLYTSQPLSYTPQPQVCVYCFEEEMPDLTAADWDYNDVVLHISHERTGAREVRFHVSLAAVGARGQVGACLHLKNIGYDEIESVTTVGDASFNKNSNGAEVPNQMLSTMQDKTQLLKSRTGDDAVINMFVDAHWATGDILEENYGLITRKLYNVTKGSSSTAQTMVPRTITYVVTFKSESELNYLSFDQIDPFVIEQYGGGRWEVHPYNYRDEQVLYPYNLVDYRLPWALVIPYGKFRHPLDGVNIGFVKGDILGFGAYGTYGHAFGQWSRDRNQAQDWYLNDYATENQVF